jgi:uncharacterized membrane protein
MSRPVFMDLFRLTEDERIKMIADHVKMGKAIAFVVENDAKADRYLEKLRKVIPDLQTKRLIKLTESTVTVKVALPDVSLN